MNPQFVFVFLAALTVSAYCNSSGCDKQCEIDSYLSKECKNKEVGATLGKNIKQATTVQAVRSILASNAETASRELQQLYQLIASKRFTQELLPQVVNSLKSSLGNCVDGSMLMQPNNLCKVPTERVRRDVIQSHGIPPPLVTHLNANFGSYMPEDAVHKLLTKNVAAASKSIADQQKQLDRCMMRVDVLSAGTADILGISMDY